MWKILRKSHFSKALDFDNFFVEDAKKAKNSWAKTHQNRASRVGSLPLHIRAKDLISTRVNPRLEAFET